MTRKPASTSDRSATLANPRILIGLGGLGGAVTLAAHHELKASGASYFRTIIVDTDDTRVVLDGVDDDFSATATLELDDQQLQVVRLTGENLADWRGQNAHILDGIFPTDLPASVSSGAAKLRIVGSAAGFANAQQIRAAIESSIDQVRQETGIDNGVLVVNISTGSSGGSGSSNVRLIAALVHDVFHKNYDAGQVRLEIRIVVVLPDCYNTVPELRPKIERNAIWTLRELSAAQREGASFRIPNGGGSSYTVSVPPGFIHTIIPISGRSTAGNISTTTALRALSTYLILDANPVVGKAIIDEMVDVYPDLEDYNRQVMGIAAHQLVLADTSDALAALGKRRVAQTFLGLPAPVASEVTALSDRLVPITFGQFAGGASLPDHDSDSLVRTWILDRSGVSSFAGMGRALTTLAAGLHLQDETGRSAPALRANDVSGLADSLVGLRFSGVSVAKPTINLDPDDIKASGSAATNRAMEEVDRAIAEYRRGLQTFFAGQDADVSSLVSHFVNMHEGEDLSSLGTQLRAALGRLEQSVPADSGEIRSTLGRIASQMETVKGDEAKAGKPKGMLPTWLGGKAHEAPATASLDLASDMIGRVHGYAQTAFGRVLAQEWNAFIGRVSTRTDEVVTAQVGGVVSSSREMARRWNGFVSSVQRIIRGHVASLDMLNRSLQDAASASIPQPVIPPDVGFRRVIGAEVTALEALLPSINPREQAKGIDIFNHPADLLTLNVSVSTGSLFTSNPVVSREISKILRGGAFLSYNPSRCGGAPVTRIFMSGPEALQQHPVVREKVARQELRYEVVEGDQVNILCTVTGVKLGAISGVEAWERQLHGQRNDLAVSMLPCQKLGSLVEINEQQIIEPFLGALIAGEDLPSGSVVEDPWSFCSPDAMLRRRTKAGGGESNWLLYPYPGHGRQPEVLGHTVTECFGAFKLDIGDCRQMATRRLADLVKDNGWASLLRQTQRFAAALLTVVTELGEELALGGDIEDPAALRAQHAKQARYEDLRWLYDAANRWATEKARTLGK